MRRHFAEMLSPCQASTEQIESVADRFVRDEQAAVTGVFAAPNRETLTTFGTFATSVEVMIVESSVVAC